MSATRKGMAKHVGTQRNPAHIYWLSDRTAASLPEIWIDRSTTAITVCLFFVRFLDVVTCSLSVFVLLSCKCWFEHEAIGRSDIASHSGCSRGLEQAITGLLMWARLADCMSKS